MTVVASQSSGRARSDPTHQHHSHLLSHHSAHLAPVPTTAASLADETVANTVGLTAAQSAHFATMECESPTSSGHGPASQQWPPPAHQTGPASSTKAMPSSASNPHAGSYHQQQHQYPTWTGGDGSSSVRQHGSSAVVGGIPTNSGILLGGVLIDQSSGHQYMTRNPQPASSSSSSSSLHRHAVNVSPSQSSLLMGAAVYEQGALPAHRSVPQHYEPQVLLSSSSSSLSSSSVPVDLSTLTALHSQQTLVTSPGLMVGVPATSLTMNPQNAGLPLASTTDLVATGQPVNVALATYPSTFAAFPQQTWLGGGSTSAPYPFTLAASSASTTESSSLSRTHANTERGDESPMVGVCVQQSPVASH